VITPAELVFVQNFQKEGESIENAIQCHSAAAYVSESVERIPRRPPPEFEESDKDMMSGISEGGFLDVALNDVNQYGPHAMVMLLGVFASLTGLALLLLMML
jgi:hypothetical protein